MATINPAKTTPPVIAGKAYLILIRKKDAKKAAVQAPVVGNGIAVKINKPKAPYLSNVSLPFFIVR